MKLFLICQILWTVILAALWTPNSSGDAVDVCLAVVCYAWVISAFALFFRLLWAWWSCIVAASAILLFVCRGFVHGLLRTGADSTSWPGWGVMLGFFVPTLTIVVALILLRSRYARIKASV
jgi:hypothetical protein